jgi:hypothetical protein
VPHPRSTDLRFVVRSLHGLGSEAGGSVASGQGATVKPVGRQRRPLLLSGDRARERGGGTRERFDMGAPLRGHGRTVGRPGAPLISAPERHDHAIHFPTTPRRRRPLRQRARSFEWRQPQRVMPQPPTRWLPRRRSVSGRGGYALAPSDRAALGYPLFWPGVPGVPGVPSGPPSPPGPPGPPVVRLPTPPFPPAPPAPPALPVSA